MLRVVEGIYLLESARFANAYLIDGGGDLTLVDAGPARFGRRLLAEIKDNGFDPAAIGRVVLTHAHGAHAGGLAEILKVRRIKVLAHPRDIPELMGNASRVRWHGGLGLACDWLRERIFPWPALEVAAPLEPGTPLRALAHWQVLHTPGHTPGSLSLFHPAKQVLICGDALSNRGGRLHVPSPCLHRDPAELRLSLQAISRLDCDILCCGHGPVLRRGAFRHIEALLREAAPA